MSTEPVQFWLKGWLSKQSRFLKKWRRRFVVLTNTQLLTYKDENINEAPTEKLSLKRCTAVKSADTQTQKLHSFCVHCGGNDYFFFAETADEKDRWIGLISGLISERAD